MGPYPKIKNCTFTIKVEQENTPVRGNYMVSGNDAYDKEVEDKILADLESNVWVWCSLGMKASWNDISSEVNYLGCCSYESYEDFKKYDEYEDMKQNAYSSLCREIDRLRNVISELGELPKSYESQSLQSRKNSQSISDMEKD